MNTSFDIKEISEGVKICSVKTSRFKTARISFNIAIPLDEYAPKNAIVPYLLSASCEKYPDYITLNKKLASLYGASLTPSISKIGEAQVVRLSMTLLDDRFVLENEKLLEECIELLCEIIFRPKIVSGGFEPGEFARQKRILLEKIESEKSDKRVYALRRLEEIMFCEEAYGINVYGSSEEVASLTEKEAYEALDRLLKHGTIQINIVSNSDVSEIAKKVKSEISDIGRNEVFRLENQIIEKAGSLKTEVEKLKVTQGKLVMGYRLGVKTEDENYAASRIMVDLFGGNTYSKLFMNVREKMSLCYYCSARMSKQKGVIFVQSGVDDSNMETAIKEINNQLEDIKKGDLKQSDLDSSILSTTDALQRVCDTPEDIDAWGYSQMTSDYFYSPEEIAKDIEKVTLEEVIEASKKVTLDTIFKIVSEDEE